MLEFSANDTCALNECKSKTQHEFSAAGICRILSETKLKAMVELSANQSGTLNEKVLLHL